MKHENYLVTGCVKYPSLYHFSAKKSRNVIQILNVGFIHKKYGTLKRLPFKTHKSSFEKLEEIDDVASLNKEERERYQNSVNVYRTHLCVMDAAKEE